MAGDEVHGDHEEPEPIGGRLAHLAAFHVGSLEDGGDDVLGQLGVRRTTAGEGD
jgi:hypothetical protein